MGDAVAERRRERERLIGLARDYVSGLASRIPLTAAAVVGSVARGDFNVWSDIDVVVVARELPPRAPDRGAMLAGHAAPGVQAVGFTEGEFLVALRKRNPLALEATADGVVLAGGEFLRAVREDRGDQGQPISSDHGSRSKVGTCRGRTTPK